MSTTGAKPAQIQSRPHCDRCPSGMDPTGWMPRPDGHGGLRRLTVYRCTGCGRIFDELWGYRESTGDL